MEEEQGAISSMSVVVENVEGLVCRKACKLHVHQTLVLWSWKEELQCYNFTTEHRIVYKTKDTQDTNYCMFSYKNTKRLTFSGERHDLFCETTLPAVLKILSLGTLVAV